MLSPELKEKSALHSGQATQKNTQLHTQSSKFIIPHESLTKKMIPLKHGSKEPLKKWRNAEFSPDDYSDGCNYGLRLGEVADNLYLVAIDLDNPNAFISFFNILDKLGIAPRIMVESGGKHRGNHFYYLTDRYIESSTFKNQDLVGEIRTGENQYIVIPPSNVETDYSVLDTKTTIQSADDFLSYVSKRIQFVPSKKLIKLFNFLTGGFYKDQDEIAYKSAGKPQELQPSNRYCSYLVALLHSNELVNSITRDTILWEKVINLLYKKMYGERYYLELNKNFLCIFHQEKNPSAGLFKKENGEILYKDFHLGSQKAFNVVEVFHAIKHNQEPKFLKGQDWTNALLELFEWIETEQIETGYLKAFDDWWNDFRTELKLKDNAFSKYIMKTLEVVMNEFRERMRKGHNQAVLAKRYVAGKLKWKMSERTKAFIVNRCMNFLVFAGLLRKAKTRNFEYTDKTGKKKQRKGYIYSIDFNCSPEQVIKAFNSLIENGIADVRKFKTATVSTYFGIEKAMEVFRGKQDKDEIETNRKRKYSNKHGWCKNGKLPFGGIAQQGSDDDVLRGRGKKRSSRGVKDRDRQRCSHYPDTERTNESDNNELSECNSNTGGTHDKTIEDKHREQVFTGGNKNESEELKHGRTKEHTGNNPSPPD